MFDSIGKVPRPVRDVIGIGTLILFCTCLVGCDFLFPQKETSKVIENPFQGQVVELVVPREFGLPNAWEILLQEWSAQTGASIQWNEYASKKLVKNAVETAGEISSGGRIIVFPLSEFSEVDSFLKPLSTDEDNDFDTSDLFKGLRERVVTRDRLPVAIPISAPVLVCYYRNDLLKKAGLKPPETWEDYQSLIESSAEWGSKLPVLEPLAPDFRGTMFLARSLAYTKHPENYSVWFDLSSGDATISSPGFVEAMNVAQRAWKSMPRSILELSPVDCRNAVIEGRAAMAIGFEPDTGDEATSSNTRSQAASTETQGQMTKTGEIGICRIPGSRRVFNRNSGRWDQISNNSVHSPGLVTSNGWAISAVGKHGAQKDLAGSNLLSVLATAQFNIAWASTPKSLCRESQCVTALAWSEERLGTEGASQLIDSVAQTLRDSQLVTELPVPRAEDFRAATASVVTRVVEEGIAPEVAIDEMQLKFEKLASEIGKPVLKSAYRQGLGLATSASLESVYEPPKP